MAKHSRSERARRVAQNEDITRIQDAWAASVPAAKAAEFVRQVAEAHARGPLPPPPDMAPGTPPRPPRPGREPKPPKNQTPSRRRY